MTVCIAAISDDNKVFGASDRMQTAGDIEFEPDLDSLPKPSDNSIYNTNPKIVMLTTAIVMMTAGDSGLQAEIGQMVRREVLKAIDGHEDTWLDVRVVVEFYVQAYEKIKANRAHSMVFSRFGLEQKTFLEASSKLSTSLVEDITNRLASFDKYFYESFGVDTIITGIDGVKGNTRPHIYQITRSMYDQNVTCHDSIGFAAVGSGRRHAESQFMLAGHSSFSPMSNTLLLTYLAKKRSEVAPGVGKGTDMFSIGPELGSFCMLDQIKDLDMKKIEAIYNDFIQGQDQAFTAAKTKAGDYMKEIFDKRISQTSQKPPDKKP